jgi:cytochrome c peroxidase
MKKRKNLLAFSVALVAGLLASRGAVRAQAKTAFTPPRGLQDQPMEVPADNPITAGKIKLGEQLFFDKRLSKTKEMSCETCHLPEKGWTDALPLSPKFDKSVNTRHTPTLYGAAFSPDLYWDGRAKGLEAQTLAAWKGQMGADPDQVAKDLEAIPAYKAAFEAELGGPPTGDRIVKALVTFVRTIQAGDTPWDRMDAKTRDKSEAGKGFKVFSEVASCTGCHLPPTFSDTLFHNIGIGTDKEKVDPGRGGILTAAAQKANRSLTPDEEKLIGAFKTPTLRGIGASGPYFHDGRAKTLDEAVDLVLKGGIKNDHLDEKLQPKTLTPVQRKELMAFLISITPEAKPYKRPALP